MAQSEAIIVDRLGSLELGESKLAVYDRPIGIQLLFEDPSSGAEHYLCRYPAGMRALRHQHSAAHTIVVLEGRMLVEGRVVGPGAYCHFPAGQPMHHGAVEDEPCLFTIIFDGPADVTALDD
jgi:quercetin dioxygenase-like cupin family protein